MVAWEVMAVQNGQMCSQITHLGQMVLYLILCVVSGLLKQDTGYRMCGVRSKDTGQGSLGGHVGSD
jgi:hypothetical protein